VLDEPRADDAAVCAFLRQQRGTDVVAPVLMPDVANVCIAAGEPRPQSLRQQELLCLHLSHADCPRYLRGGLSALAGPEAGPARRTSRFPSATIPALLVLVLSAGLSLGFVLRRGGFDLSGFAAPSAAAPRSTTAAVAPSSPAEGASPGVTSPSPELTLAPSVAPSLVPSPSPSPSASQAPSLTPDVTPTPATSGTPMPNPTGSASRMKLLTACPGVNNCYIYKIGAYGTLVDIANFFGVSVKSIYAMNPGLNPRFLHHGDPVRIPTPTK
jgi:hypothetical protein